VISVLLSGGSALEAQDRVSAVGDYELSNKSESDFSRITRHLCTSHVKEVMRRWFLCCCQLELLLKVENG
jgi:hypothetical protein